MIINFKTTKINKNKRKVRQIPTLIIIKKKWFSLPSTSVGRQAGRGKERRGECVEANNIGCEWVRVMESGIKKRGPRVTGWRKIPTLAKGGLVHYASRVSLPLRWVTGYTWLSLPLRPCLVSPSPSLSCLY